MIDKASFSKESQEFARTYNDALVSPFKAMMFAPGNTALYMVGSINLPKGDYTIKGKVDDIGIFYIDGQHKGDMDYHSKPGNQDEFSFSLDKDGAHPLVIYNKNVPNATPAYLMASVFNSAGEKVLDLNKDKFEYSLTTDLNCVE